jgi:hypothetical protein
VNDQTLSAALDAWLHRRRTVNPLRILAQRRRSASALRIASIDAGRCAAVCVMFNVVVRQA